MEHQSAIKTDQPDRRNQAASCAKPALNPHGSGYLFRKLQQLLGNNALGNHIQTKLKISQPEDEHEQEADRVADQVMRMPDPGANLDRTEGLTQALQPSPGRPHLLRKCGDCEAEEQLQRKEIRGGSVLTGAGVEELGGGQPLSPVERSFFEPRFNRDFGHVRIHTDTPAAESAKSVDARAYTVSRNVVFGAGQYAPETADGKKLLAHELAHVLQAEGHPRQSPVAKAAGRRGPEIGTQLNESLVSRAPTYPDASCANVQNSINRAWPTSKRWVQLANSRLAEPAGVAGGLQTHFKLDPNDASQAADLATVRRVFARMEEIFDMEVDNRCIPERQAGNCSAPDGGRYAAYAYSGRPDMGITHCLPSPDVSFLGQEDLVATLVHEVAHEADPSSTDFSYRYQPVRTSYANMTRQQAIHNGDSYSEFARDLYFGGSTTPLMVSLSTGALLSSGTPRWAIGASFGVRSRTGIEVFDLVGGVHVFLAVDPAAGAGQPIARDVGGELNLGVMSRSARTHMFVDTRLGLFATTDLALQEPVRGGLSSSTVIGWADSRFRAGVNLRMMFDFLRSNNAVIIGGEFTFGP